MLGSNAVVFIAAQFGSRFANSFLTTAVRYELLELGGVTKFASAQVANQVSRVFMQQLSGVLTDSYSLKRLYVTGEAMNLLLVVMLLPSMLGASTVLFVVNVGLGLTQAFSQPIAKSLPPAVASPEDLAIVNSWDLTGDKIGRNLAPMAFTMVSSTLGFQVALMLSLVTYIALVGLKLILRVEDRPAVPMPAKDAAALASPSTVRRLLGVFQQVWDGMMSLKSDRLIGLLILNTLATNMVIYPLGSVVFPVIFKAVPVGAIEQEGSVASRFILSLQSSMGIQKKKAWMNYAALVSLGGVFGPFLSTILVYWIKAMSAKRPELVNWIGLNCGIIGQVVTIVPLIFMLHFIQSFTAGMRICLMFIVWSAMNAMNNVTTIYFNAHTQQRLSRSERGRFIANILTLFALANSVGLLLYGWALSSDRPEEQIATSTKILSCALIVRIIILILLRSEKDRTLLKKDS
mmetsp:Transcript_29434/g.80487  ORF Transcript_29434/g.80487 Transcript_29434/m.80487 type:complete len:461 (+) Transcript_29434:110-1492(+)